VGLVCETHSARATAERRKGAAESARMRFKGAKRARPELEGMSRCFRANWVVRPPAAKHGLSARRSREHLAARRPPPGVPVRGSAPSPCTLPLPHDPAEEEEDDDSQRAAPNTAFLGRLVAGVQNTNHRVLVQSASAAANKSIGATGAGSLRLQMQRLMASRAPALPTLRRVVLNSAQQQRLTLCAALLAEVAQGFGFNLTVRQPGTNSCLCC
jgi:hypothetical protein